MILFSSSFSGLYWLQITVTEEKRLAVSVHQIDAEVSVVPRGAFIKSPRGLVQLNRSFCGKYVYTVGEITMLHFTYKEMNSLLMIWRQLGGPRSSRTALVTHCNGLKPCSTHNVPLVKKAHERLVLSLPANKLLATKTSALFLLFLFMLPLGQHDGERWCHTKWHVIAFINNKYSILLYLL